MATSTHIPQLDLTVTAYKTNDSTIYVSWTTPAGASGINVYYWLSYKTSETGADGDWQNGTVEALVNGDGAYYNHLSNSANIDLSLDSGHKFYRFEVKCTTSGYINLTNYEYGTGYAIVDTTSEPTPDYDSSMVVSAQFVYPSIIYVNWTDSLASTDSLNSHLYALEYEVSDDGVTWTNGTVTTITNAENGYSGYIDSNGIGHYNHTCDISLDRNHGCYRFKVMTYTDRHQISNSVQVISNTGDLTEGVATISFSNGEDDWSEILFNWSRTDNSPNYNYYELGYWIFDDPNLTINDLPEPTWVTEGSQNGLFTITDQTSITHKINIDSSSVNNGQYIMVYFNISEQASDHYWGFASTSNKLQFKTLSKIKLRLNSEWIDCVSFVKYNGQFVPCDFKAL